jgi:hypothetical protein
MGVAVTALRAVVVGPHSVAPVLRVRASSAYGQYEISGVSTAWYRNRDAPVLGQLSTIGRKGASNSLLKPANLLATILPVCASQCRLRLMSQCRSGAARRLVRGARHVDHLSRSLSRDSGDANAEAGLLSEGRGSARVLLVGECLIDRSFSG